ncbi:hypothetical protein ACMHYQ_02485 [Ectopseudomonas guguanensis]|jgi:hypothetical protein|uniref:hypothetical protein n=1 Tax=Ectopseudomonas guguanensis TaxID=1198456 RepID=UPI0032E4F53C
MNYKEILLSILIPGAFAGGFYGHQWWVENSNSRILVEGSYILKTDLDEQFISKGEVSRNYIHKAELEKSYIHKDEYQKLGDENKALLEQISEAESAITNDSRLLAEGEAWKSKNPEFYIEFGKSMYRGEGVTAYVGTSFQDGKPSWSQLYNVGDDREWKFRHNGKLYKLFAKYTESKGRVLIEAVLTDKI